MKDYAELTERGKGRRLRNLVYKALQNYEIEVRKIRLVTNEFNGIFRLDTVEGQKYVMRIAAPGNGHPYEHIQSEMEFLNFLRHSESINSPTPVKTKSGEWVTTVSDDFVPESRHCVIFSWLSGVDLEKRISPQNWRRFGKLSAQLHQLSASFEPPSDFSIYSFDKIYPFEGDLVLLSPENRSLYTAEEYELLKMAVTGIHVEIDEWHRDKSAICVTHGDLHQWNVQIARGKLSIIDFEDIMWAHPIQDIGTTFYHTRMLQNFEPLLTAFKEGYETICPFPGTYEGQIEVHVLARQLCILNDVILYRGIQNFPHLIPRTIDRIRYMKEHIWKV